MTDELVWERLAISVGQWHSVLPRLHGEVIRSLSQLYPLLLAPFFWSGFVSTDLQRAHVFNAWLMSSAAIPAFLLARRVTGRRWPAYVTALLAACTPWIVYSTVLLTEVAAYPVFLWAILAMHKAITDPSPRNDLLLVLALAVAFLARTQFGLLLVVLPVALVLFHLRSRAAGGTSGPRRTGLPLRAAARRRARSQAVGTRADAAQRLRRRDGAARPLGLDRRLVHGTCGRPRVRDRDPSVSGRKRLAARERRPGLGRPEAARLRVHRRGSRP